MCQLCEQLGIDKVRTSPYHPETNGAVERMHGTMKSILGKCIDDGLDWVEQLCFADSGYSPFDMVYGFRVRTPLDALYHGLYEVEAERLNVCEWVTRMAERLENVRDSAALGVAKGKESRLQYLNRGTKMREFKEGDLVLYRVPGRTCKLSDSWQGPYKVVKRVGSVNYRIGRVGNERHAKVVHVNCIKEFNPLVPELFGRARKNLIFYRGIVHYRFNFLTRCWLGKPHSNHISLNRPRVWDSPHFLIEKIE